MFGMDPQEARQRFAELVRVPSTEFDLLEACLLVAAEESPGTDLDRAHKRLRSLRARLTDELTGGEDYLHAAWALRQILCVEWGMQADPDAAEIPEGVLLTTLLERRQAHPLVFAALYRDLARSVGLPVEIVALPGSVAMMFVDRWGRPYVDPLARGHVVTREELTRQLAARLGERAARLPRLLGELPSRRVLVRMLLLLKRAWARRQQPRRALAASERILLLEPGSLVEQRDRGLLSKQLGDRRQAIRDLRGYLENRPDALDASRIARLLSALEREERGEA
jgi:regulator of sirC expression with transglutaminase-like and TPR domain